MSFSARPFACSIGLCFFLTRLLILHSVGEPSLQRNAAFAASTDNSDLDSAQKSSATEGEESLATSKTAPPLAASAKGSAPELRTTTGTSLSANESTVEASDTEAATDESTAPQREGKTGKQPSGTWRKPTGVRRAEFTHHPESTARDELRRQSRQRVATTSTAGGGPSGTAESPALINKLSCNIPQESCRAGSVATAAGGNRPPAVANAVVPSTEATIPLAGIDEDTAATVSVIPSGTPTEVVAEDAALYATPEGLPATTVAAPQNTFVAQPLAASPAAVVKVSLLSPPVPTPAASAAIVAGQVTQTNPPLRILKGQENVVCRNVAVEAQSVCKKLKPAQRTYPCTKQVVEKFCEDVPIVLQKMCTKTFHERKPFKCDRVEYKSECIQKKEITRTECVQTVIKEEAYPCPKLDYITKCNQKPALTPSVCKHEVQKEFHYPCERVVKEEQCAEVDKEVDRVCEEEVVVPEKYDCSKTVYVKKCSPAAGTAATGIRATAGEMSAPPAHGTHEVPSYEVPSEEGGEKAPRRLRKAVTTPNAIMVPLPKAQISLEMCVDVPQVKRKTCTREVVKKERRPCKGMKKEIQCSNVTKIIQEVCSTVKKVVEPYACTKTEMQQECSTVAKQVEDTCTRQVPVDEKGPCEIEIFKNECVPVPVRIPDVCFETRPKTEVYDCSENSSKSVCKEELKEVEQQCVQIEYREVEYACTQVEHVEKCVVPDTAPSVVSISLPPQKYSKAQHDKAGLLRPPEAMDHAKEYPRHVEQLPAQATLPMKEPLIRKEYATVMTGPAVKRTKPKWREKLHKLGDPDLGEKEEEYEEVQKSKTHVEDRNHKKDSKSEALESETLEDVEEKDH